MPSLRVFLRCVGEAVCANGLKALMSAVPMGEAVFEIAKDTYERLQRDLREKEQIAAIASAAQATVEEARKEAAAAVAEIRASVDLPADAEQQLINYLERVPAAVRQSLRRPADPSGKTVPQAMTLSRPEQIAAMLPARLPRFRTGDRPPGVGNWELVELLGAGGFGEVWKAKHPTLDGIPPVALKFCLDASAASALRHEAHLLSQVMQQSKHPGFVPLRQAYLDTEPICLEYEFVSGGDLVGLVNEWHKAKQLPRRLINSTLLSLVKVIAHAHALNPPIVHRDLKPANILVERALDGRFRVRIADFGIGSIVPSQAGQNGETARGMLTTSLRGSHTPLYASPQQQKGEDPDPRDDVHALGVIWYQMLTGDLSAGVPADWVSVLGELRQPTPLIELLGQCVSSRAEKRLGSAVEFAERLEKVLKQEAGPGPEMIAAPVAPKRSQPVKQTQRGQGVDSLEEVPERTRKPDRPATVRRREDEDDRPSHRETKRQSDEPEAPNRTPMYVALGGGAAALLFMVVVIVVLTRPSRNAPAEPKTDSLVQAGLNLAKNRTQTQPKTKVGGSGALAGAKSKNLPSGAIDLLAMLDLSQDAVTNKEKWAIVGTELHCTQSSFVPSVQFPYRPPAEYDFVVSFAQPRLRNGISLVVPKPDVSGQFYWFLGGGGRDFGFHSEPLYPRENTSPLIVADRTYTTTLQFRAGRLRGLLDGKLLMEIVPDYKRLTVDNWRQYKDPSRLGLTCDDPTVFESAYVIEVTGRGTRVR